ncbi:MAG: hypothetical protein AAB116_19885 [Candidatus Poribacteria bacterium]
MFDNKLLFYIAILISSVMFCYEQPVNSDELSEHDMAIQRELILYHFEAGEYYESIKIAKKYLKETPGDAEILNLRGLAYLKNKNYVNAAWDISEAINNAQDPAIRAHYRVNLAEVYKGSNDGRRSLEQLKLALTDAPEDTEAKRLIGGLTGGSLYVKLKKSSQKTSRTNLTLQLATRYDSNVLLKPDEYVSISRISSKSGFVIPVFAQGKLSFPGISQQDASVSAHLSYNMNLNGDLKNYDNLDIGAVISQDFFDGGTLRISLTDGIHYFLTNSSGMTGLLLENRLTPQFEIMFSKKKRLVLGLPLSYGGFTDDAIDVKNRKTFFKPEVTSEFHSNISGNINAVFGGTFIFNESEGVNYQQYGGRFNTKVNYQIGDHAFNPFFVTEYRYLKYPKREPARIDNSFSLTGGLSKNLEKETGKKLFSKIEFILERSVSNDASATYLRSISSVSIGYRI